MAMRYMSAWLSLYARGNKHMLQFSPFVWSFSLGRCPCCESVSHFGPLNIVVQPLPKNLATLGPGVGIGCSVSRPSYEIVVLPLSWAVYISKHWASFGPLKFAAW